MKKRIVTIVMGAGIAAALICFYRNYVSGRCAV